MPNSLDHIQTPGFCPQHKETLRILQCRSACTDAFPQEDDSQEPAQKKYLWPKTNSHCNWRKGCCRTFPQTRDTASSRPLTEKDYAMLIRDSNKESYAL